MTTVTGVGQRTDGGSGAESDARSDGEHHGSADTSGSATETDGSSCLPVTVEDIEVLTSVDVCIVSDVVVRNESECHMK